MLWWSCENHDHDAEGPLLSASPTALPSVRLKSCKVAQAWCFCIALWEAPTNGCFCAEAKSLLSVFRLRGDFESLPGPPGSGLSPGAHVRAHLPAFSQHLPQQPVPDGLLSCSALTPNALPPNCPSFWLMEVTQHRASSGGTAHSLQSIPGCTCYQLPCNRPPQDLAA